MPESFDVDECLLSIAGAKILRGDDIRNIARLLCFWPYSDTTLFKILEARDDRFFNALHLWIEREHPEPVAHRRLPRKTILERLRPWQPSPGRSGTWAPSKTHDASARAAAIDQKICETFRQIRLDELIQYTLGYTDTLLCALRTTVYAMRRHVHDCLSIDPKKSGEHGATLKVNTCIHAACLRLTDAGS